MKSPALRWSLVFLLVVWAACSPRVMKEMINDLRQVNKPPPSNLGPEQLLPDSLPLAGLTSTKAEPIFNVEGVALVNYVPSPLKKIYEGASGTLTVVVCKFYSDGAARNFWSQLETNIRDTVENKRGAAFWRGGNSFAAFLVPGERAVLARQVGEVLYYIQVPTTFPSPTRLAAKIDRDILNHFKQLHTQAFEASGEGGTPSPNVAP